LGDEIKEERVLLRNKSLKIHVNINYYETKQFRNVNFELLVFSLLFIFSRSPANDRKRTDFLSISDFAACMTRKLGRFPFLFRQSALRRYNNNYSLFRRGYSERTVDCCVENLLLIVGNMNDKTKQLHLVSNQFLFYK
jgi:hypothetical protein